MSSAVACVYEVRAVSIAAITNATNPMARHIQANQTEHRWLGLHTRAILDKPSGRCSTGIAASRPLVKHMDGWHVLQDRYDLGDERSYYEDKFSVLLTKLPVVIPGDTQPAAVHLLAHAINEKLRAFGSTVTFTDPLQARPSDAAADFKQLVDDMNGGKVGLLLLMGGNPAYDSPADFDFPKALANVQAKGLAVHHGLARDV